MDVVYFSRKSFPSVVHHYREWLETDGKGCEVVATSVLQSGEWFNLIVTFKKPEFIGQ